jgi:hypothetical protein
MSPIHWDEIMLKQCEAALGNGYSAEMGDAEVDAMVSPTFSPVASSGIGDLPSNEMEVVGLPAAIDPAADSVAFAPKITVFYGKY